jgi:hypothetical protein
MTIKLPSPSATYAADVVYTDRYELAIKYLAERLTDQAVISTLQMHNDKPVYVIEYNLARHTLAHVDDIMATRIVKDFMAAGWGNVYWETLSTDRLNIHNPVWGYTFCFERPIETIPYDVLVRILPQSIQDMKVDKNNNIQVLEEYLKTHIEKIVTAGQRVRPAVGFIGEFAEYMQDIGMPGPRHTGVYKRKGSSEEYVLLDLGGRWLIYCGGDRPLYVQQNTTDLNSNAWFQFQPGLITLDWQSTVNALTDLERFIKDPSYTPPEFPVRRQPQYPHKE